MADFDLSLLAKFDTSSVETGGQKVENTIDKVAKAEQRASTETRKAADASRQAAKEEREHAKALDEVKSALDPAFAAQQKMNKLMEQAETLYKRGAISLGEYQRMQKISSDAMKNGAASAGQLRAANAQLGFQLQDIVQGLTMGINPMVIFGQQAGQAAQAVSMMGGTAGRVGAFLSGPWGAMILGAVTVLGMLASSFLKSSGDSDKLSGALDFQRMTTDELRKAVAEELEQKRKSVQVGFAAEQQAIATAKANLKEALTLREKTKAMMDNYLAASQVNTGDAGANVSANAAGAMMAGFTARDLEKQDAAIKQLQETLRMTEIPAAARAAEAAIDKQAAATTGLQQAQSSLNEMYRVGIITYAQLKKGLEGAKVVYDRETDAIRENERERNKANRAREQSVKLAEKEKQLSSFINPIASGGRITGRFGDNRKTHAHGGLDIAAPTGTAVRAPQVGVVEAVGYASDYGKYVIINHGAWTKTRFAHLSDNSVVRKGQSVNQGDTIGKVGSTGRSTGPHLHYEVTVNGKKVDPSKAKFLIDGMAVAQEAGKAADATEDFATKAAEQIARVTAQYDEQPRAIDNVQKETRALNALIAELKENNVDGLFDPLIAKAEEAKVVVEESLVRPYREMREESEKRIAVNILLAQGLDTEAEAMQRIWELEAKLGPLTADRKQEVLEMVTAERAVTEELQRRKEIQEYYLNATRSVRQEIENIISGTGKLSNLKNIGKQLNAKLVTEQLFGGVFRDLEKHVKENTGIKSSVDQFTGETDRAGKASGNFADAVNGAISKINGISTSSPGAVDEPYKADFDRVLGKDLPGTSSKPTIVEGMKDGVTGMKPIDYFTEMGKKVVSPLLSGLDEIIGVKLFSGLEGILGGAFGGYMTGGMTGGILGGLKGLAGSIKGMPEGIMKGLNGGLKGAQTGTTAAGLMKSLGIKTSTTGAQIGGAIGGMTQIPGLDIAGSIVGGLIGGMFKKARSARAHITGVDAIDLGGKDKKNYDAAEGLAGSVVSGLSRVADALGAQIGSFSTTIGVRDKKFRVNTSGTSLKTSKGATNFGDDEAGAIAFAIADAIADGAIKGISPAVAKALRSSSDIDKALAEAVAVSDLEKKLKYMGNEWAEALADFASIAAERVRLAQEYGLDLLAVERLNAVERKKILDQAIEAQIGSLKTLLDDLKYGDLFEGTPDERRSKILAEIEDAKQDVRAGVEGSTNRLADLERQLVETSREAYGTAGTEYTTDRDQAIATAERVIAEEKARIARVAAQTEEQIGLASESNQYLSTMTNQLDQLIVLGGGTPFVKSVAAAVYPASNNASYRPPVVNY